MNEPFRVYVSWDWPRRYQITENWDGSRSLPRADCPYNDAETAARVRMFNKIEHFAEAARADLGLPYKPPMTYTRDYFKTTFHQQARQKVWGKGARL